jgi:cytochrome bd ubiquinol oxidase subunit I
MMTMDPVMLARIQFAFTVAYHFIFVPISLGMTLMLVIAERRYYKSGKPEDRAMSDFFKKLFAATFAIGVATGITMEFAFGTNWASYSRFVGDIFGAPLAAEGVFAFFLESTFLGILLFGRDRVSKRFYYVSTWLVLFGAHLSALWIIIANSWQQTPAGFVVKDGKAILTNFWEAAFNPSTLPRYFHTVASTWVVGGFLVAAIAAWYLLKGKHVDFAKSVMPFALTIALLASIAMPFLGHWSADQVAATQPTKLAAFEGQYKTQSNAPLMLIGWTDENAQQTTALGVPAMLSLLVGFKADTTIKGLEAYPRELWPPINLTFQTYHVMVLMGIVLVLIAALAFFMRWRGKLDGSRFTLWLLVAAPFLAQLAIQTGWAAAEIGRQPWIVYGQLKTADAISAVVPAYQVALTLVLFLVIYLVLFIGWARIFFGIIGTGPKAPADAGVREPVPAPTSTGSATVAAASDLERR